MTIEQLGMLAKNRFPNNPEYKGKSDREIGEFLTTKHYAYRGRRGFDFSKKEEEKKVSLVNKIVVPDLKPTKPKFVPEPVKKVEYQTPVEATVGVGTGMNQEVAKMAFGLSSIGQKGLEYFVGGPTRWALEKAGLEPSKPTPTAMETFKDSEWLKAKNVSQEMGQKIVEYGAYVAPTPVGKSTGFYKGIKILDKLKAPKIATKVAEKVAEKVTISSPKVTKLIDKGSKIFSKPIVSRSVSEGFRFGGITALQKGEIDKEVIGTAAIGAAFPPVVTGAGRVLSPFATKIGTTLNKISFSIKDKAQKIVWEGLLSRNTDEIIGNPIAIKAASLGIIAPSKKAIKTKVEKNLEDLFQEVKGLTDPSKKVVSVEKLKTSLFDKLNKNEQLRSQIKETDPIHELAVMLGKRRDLSIIIEKSLPVGKKELTMKEALKLQLEMFREIERNIDRTVPEITKLKAFLAKGLKDDINKLMPEIKTANDKVSVLAQVLPAIERALITDKTAIPINQLDVITGLGGYAVGAGVYPVLAKKVIEQTLFKTAASKVINSFNGLPSKEKIPFYLGLKGLLAGYVEEVVKED